MVHFINEIELDSQNATTHSQNWKILISSLSWVLSLWNLLVGCKRLWSLLFMDFFLLQC